MVHVQLATLLSPIMLLLPLQLHGSLGHAGETETRLRKCSIMMHLRLTSVFTNPLDYDLDISLL